VSFHARDHVEVSDSATVRFTSGRGAHDQVPVSDIAIAGQTLGVRASDHVSVSDKAEVAWLRLGPVVARSAAQAEITIGRAAPDRAHDPTRAADARPAEQAGLPARMQLKLTVRQWDVAMFVGGATLGDLVDGKVGAVIGGVVFIAWWRWMLSQARSGRL
jgi:hypothetical protein